MNKFVFLFILTCSSFSVYSQDITGFLGIDFGTTRDEARNKMQEKRMAISTELSNELADWYPNSNFAGLDADLIYLKYNSDGKLFEAGILIEAELSSQSKDLFHEVERLIESKYGTGKSFERYDWPYETNDGHWETAFKLGKGHLSTYWIKDTGAIGLELTDKLIVKLTYQSTNLVKEEVERRKAQNAKDL